MSRIPLAILVVVVACGPLGVATATSGQSATTLTVTDAAIDPGESVTHALSLDRVPDGLSGFEVTLALRGDDAATVEGAAYPSSLRPTTPPRIGPDNRTVTLEAADLAAEIEPGATDVSLANVTVNGTATGRATLAVVDAQIDADDGGRIDPTVDAGEIAVGVAPATETATSATATTAESADERTTAGSADASPQSEADPARESTTASASPSPADTTTGTGPGLGVLTAVFALVAVSLLARR